MSNGYCYGLGHMADLRYVWTFPNGNVLELCVECCAGWRMNATEEPSLRPKSIEEIRTCSAGGAGRSARGGKPEGRPE